MLIFSVMIIIPLLNYETYWSEKTSYDTGIDLLHLQREENPDYINFFVMELVSFHRDERAPIASVDLHYKNLYSGINYREYRDEELSIY
jgi:hypothetical protein